MPVKRRNKVRQRGGGMQGPYDLLLASSSKGFTKTNTSPLTVDDESRQRETLLESLEQQATKEMRSHDKIENFVSFGGMHDDDDVEFHHH
jgi:hypothetical protein